MAKTPKKLSRIDIVLHADADVIKEAYESRLKIDELLEARNEAYKQIAELEQQIEETVGEEGLFLYPEPPLPIAGAPKGPVSRKQPGAKTGKPSGSGQKAQPKVKKTTSQEPAASSSEPKQVPVES
jgi:hypothetical protein